MEGKKILVIEDEPSMQNALVERLKKHHFQVFRAGDGKAGLDIALKEDIDLILLDLLMPFMDGLQVLDEINKSNKDPKPIVIFLSNYVDPYKINHALKNGATDYLVKSDCKMKDIVDRVEKELK